MRLLLDTNVLSEPLKPRPDPNVERFVVRNRESSCYASMISVAELHRGIALMPEGQRRTRLAKWVDEELPAHFGDRLLPVTFEVAAAWGEVMAVSRRRGLNLATLDAFLAATARVHGLTLATRNIRDFEKLDLDLVNPWDEV